jgi:hypothetical protein
MCVEKHAVVNHKSAKDEKITEKTGKILPQRINLLLMQCMHHARLSFEFFKQKNGLRCHILCVIMQKNTCILLLHSLGWEYSI